ncbi:MAG: 30S ribosomal protein S4, partial [Candidatus Fermentibacteraceae bacterium]|nr:30S ribosomal protein S4 [Candidatus Fermentibacteraceae bacterium]
TMKGETGHNLLQLIERRLDNVVARSGFVRSIPSARQLVGHGHVTVNGRKVDIPSFSVKVGDVISLKEKSKKLKAVEENITEGSGIGIPPFMDVDPATRKIIMKMLPAREDVPLEVDERMVVEFYSK